MPLIHRPSILSTAPDPSKRSDGRMSTSSAKIRELDSAIQMQKKTNDKQDAKTSERVSHSERQLHRINDLDTNFSKEQETDFGHRLNLFETRMVNSVQEHRASSNNTMACTKSILERPILCLDFLEDSLPFLKNKWDPPTERRLV